MLSFTSGKLSDLHVLRCGIIFLLTLFVITQPHHQVNLKYELNITTNLQFKRNYELFCISELSRVFLSYYFVYDTSLCSDKGKSSRNFYLDFFL